MRSLFLTLLTLGFSPAAMPQSLPNPKLVLVITIDQFRYDYLTRFRNEYTGGFRTLLAKGAVFTNARYEHFPTVTAVGHATILSGALPSLSGIIANDWYDRESGKQVTSVLDETVKMVGGTGGNGASPRRLLVSTVGDELKIARGNQCRVVGMSFKDRGAILPAGHMADGAYWFDSASGHMVSSTYYMSALPAWVQAFNQDAGDRYRGAEWLGKKLPADDKVHAAVAASPFGNEMLEAFAERAIEAERLGGTDSIDLLSLSFSSNDYVGHEYGPDSPEVRELCLQTDRLLERLFRFIDGRIGLHHVLIVLTSDHGVAPMPEAQTARRMPGGRMPARIVRDTVRTALAGKYGEARWILSPSEHSLSLNHAVIAEMHLSLDEVVRTARDAVLTIPHVLRAYTRTQLLGGGTLEDTFGRRILNSFHPRRGADLYIFLEPYWFFGASGTTHGTTYSYDAHVPVIFMGPGIRAGYYHQTIAINDIAPTLATMLEIETPSGSSGRALGECFSAPVAAAPPK